MNGRIKPIAFPVDKIRKKWPIHANNVTPGVRLDHVFSITAKFFSEERVQYWPSLKLEPTKGLLLAGPKGIGKSISLKTAVRMVTCDPNLNRKIKILTVLQIEQQYKYHLENKKGQEYLDELTYYPELVIDDIGKEDPKFNDFGTIRNLIADIMDLRYIQFQEGRVITHGTTNLKPERLEQLYDSRLIDRMKEMFCFQIVKGESKRVNPIKDEISVAAALPEISEIDSRRQYLIGFMSVVNTDSFFYDKNDIAWNFMLRNGIADEILLDNLDFKIKAKNQADKDYIMLTLGKSYTDIESFQRSYNEEAEILKLVKHQIIQYYAKGIKIEDFTDEQIMK